MGEVLHTNAGTLRRRIRHGGSGPVGAIPQRLAAIAIACVALLAPLALTATPAGAAEPAGFAQQQSAPATAGPEIAAQRSAADPPAATPSPSASATTPPPPVEEVAPAATTITADPSNFSGTGFAIVGGTRQPDSTVTVTADGAEVCVDPPNGTAAFECGSIPLPDGAAIGLRAVESRGEATDPVPDAAVTTLAVLGPPVLDGSGAFITTGLVSGTARPGASVTVSVDGAADAGCSAVPVPTSTFWSCNLAAGSGGYAVRAQQSDPAIAQGRISGFSVVQRVTVDRDIPSSALITSPAPGARILPGDLVVTGTGESGAAVDVYADNVPACSTSVSGGQWSCSIVGLTRGLHTLQAVLRDAAGNYASPGPTVRALVTTTAKERAGTVAPPAPVTPDAPTPPSDTAEPTIPGGGDSGATPDGGGTEESPAPFSWSAPTGFGLDVVSFADAVRGGTWITAALAGVLFVALFAIPVRMLASSLRGRMGRLQLTGRNRRDIPPELPEPATRPNPWVEALVPVAVAAGFIAFGVGVAGEVRYLRLFIAIGLGLAVLNIVAAAAIRLSTRAIPTARLRILPLMLLAAGGTALISRWTGLEPPVVAGVVLGAAFAAAVPARDRATAGFALLGAVTGTGVLGWMLLGFVRSADGFWGTFASETLATLCLAGLGSALVLVVPIASLPGRAVLEWSPPAWIASTLVVATVVAAVTAGGISTRIDVLPWLLSAVAFAALCVATWAFVRFVEPQTRS